jgi:excisionase family DNA binding protein
MTNAKKTFSPTGTDDDRLETVDQVALELQVSRATVYRLLRSGALSAVKLGTLTRIRRLDRLAFMRGAQSYSNRMMTADPT